MVEAVVSTVAAEAFMVAWAEVASVVVWLEVASVAAGSAAVHTSLAEVIGADMATDTVAGTAEVTVVATATAVATDMDRASWEV
jgi:hypothetical protein